MALPLADKIKPKNNGTFALVDAADVDMGEMRLDEAFAQAGEALSSMAQEMETLKQSGGMPVVTTEDSGKFLRVVDGAWAAVTVESAEEASF